MICKCDVVVFYFNSKVHDFMNCVCNNMYEHGFCIYVMVCMDIDSFLLPKRNINHNKLHMDGRYK